MLDVVSQGKSVASQNDVLTLRDFPPPDGAVAGRFKTRDGVTLRYVRWSRPRGRLGTVCLFQGRAEFVEKYFEVVRELLQRGFSVATFDWRGQGLSERPLRDPRKGHVGDFPEYDNDVEAFMREVALPDCPPPYYALGHSMAGATLLRMAEQRRYWFERTVLSAPMIGLAGGGGSPSAKSAAHWLRRFGLGKRYIPGGGATAINTLPFKDNALTSDPDRYQRTTELIGAFPQLALGSPTVAWLESAYRQMAEFASPSFSRGIQQPILIVGAGNDRVVSTPIMETFAQGLPTGSRVVIAGAKHEILMEQDRFRAQFWAAFDAFVPPKR
ncbi:phospholipase YtpA [Variibacter gotjawalensis]|uniref:Phospholipase YtpA n=1 Tax=Variibacter gotjawalensis TaxID=1333996 RepID=A0A0S3PPA8_9BRAD|nr:alpha/beta hydrolase [Variibacter gotjawalensis]NIK48036.1 lysophospholipase [Variibacter gotjawalensis]RZS49913.1 lysophospholipase [Variibacter gotjawalensis]BAT57741.1 phospholipase YtpA [Variibacter gotjawalensis]